MSKLPGLDFDEAQGFRVADQTCLNRCSRHQLILDYPILRRIYPLVRGMKMLDRVAFAADLLMLGYTCRQIAPASRCGHKKILRLRRGMREMGLIAPCGCGRDGGHKGTCSARRTGKPVIGRQMDPKSR